MTIKCHTKTLLKALGLSLALTLICVQSPLFAQPEEKAIPEPETKSPVDLVSGLESSQKRVLPSIDELVNAKINALSKKLTEQQELLTRVNIDLENERTLESKASESHSYLSLSIINTAPPLDYELKETKVYLDGMRNPLARGGKRNQGLPRREHLFFGKVSPGCHDILVEATYVRLKNDLISRFQVDRVMKLSARQAFIAQEGNRVEIEIEGFEKQNTLLSFYRGPALRFNKSVRPNFLPGAGLVSLNEVTNQGHVNIAYVTQDSSQHRLVEKSIAIDGMPILRAETHNDAKLGNIIFDAPLAEGKHRLSVTLIFAEKKWIQGGANYNFKLTFDRDFFVSSGQTTLVNLVGMPEGGIKSDAKNTRYAKVTSQILSPSVPDVFPNGTCKEIEKAEAKAQELRQKAAKKTEIDKKKAGIVPPPPEQKAESKAPIETEPRQDVPKAPQEENKGVPVDSNGVPLTIPNPTGQGE